MNKQFYKTHFACKKALLLLLLWVAGGYAPARAAEFCTDNYYIDVTLPNQARWDMCWEHRNREGIVLHKIHYTPRGGVRRMILNQAALAQIHVPYDDNGARYHDISDYGLGNNYMSDLSTQECPGGKLLAFGSKKVICQQVETDDSAYRYADDRLQGNALSLFSVSKIGAYNYIPSWRFMDDGAIEPGVGATGALQRYGSANLEEHGWLVSDNKVGIAHLHNFFWKLDFDLGGTSRDDYVEELDFVQQNGRSSLVTQRFTREAARKIDPSRLRLWRVVDGHLKNSKGLPMSYEIRLPQAEYQDIGPSSEPFTHNDFYVTRYKACELFASHNPGGEGCVDNLAGFVNGENLQGEDLVVWPSTTFYHMPRAEDAPRMDAHWSHISITPRDWHAANPLSAAGDVSGSVLTNSGSGSGSGNSSGGNGTESGGGTGTDTGGGTDAGAGGVDGASGESHDGTAEIIYQDDFETGSRWVLNPHGTDTASSGQWQAGQAQITRYQDVIVQPGNAASGHQALVTGLSAGASVGSNDIDGGLTSMRSASIDLPANARYTLKMAYYFAHLWNASSLDLLRISVEQDNGSRHVLLEQAANLNNRPAQWATLNADLSRFAGKRVYLLVEASDAGSGSIVEAAIDHVSIEKLATDTDTTTENGNGAGTGNQRVFSEDFEGDLNWVLNPGQNDTASSGLWQAGIPEATAYQGSVMQLGSAASGHRALLTGVQAGSSVGAADIDGGTTTLRSPLINLAAGRSYQLQLDYYFAHLWNTSSADFLRMSVENQQGVRQQILNQVGVTSIRQAAWTALTVDLSQFAGSSIHLVLEAADGGGGSIVEAAVDNIRIDSH